MIVLSVYLTISILEANSYYPQRPWGNTHETIKWSATSDRPNMFVAVLPNGRQSEIAIDPSIPLDEDTSSLQLRWISTGRGGIWGVTALRRVELSFSPYASVEAPLGAAREAILSDTGIRDLGPSWAEAMDLLAQAVGDPRPGHRTTLRAESRSVDPMGVLCEVLVYVSAALLLLWAALRVRGKMRGRPRDASE
ncbi:MAG: hypothetical protein EA380_00925 [Phycisphaeraceae bacterium]|nr:MAG: hypothetical protein EA380_00925 [Phycisphaeraceae bacterium]